MHNFENVLKGFYKRATAVMTPEAMQSAMQPPMDPSMGGMPPGGAPMPPPQGGAPMPPPADPAAGGGAMPPQGSGGGQIPPEILQDQLFMQFMQTMGVMFDPQSGTFVDPNGQPLSVDEVMQIYDMFQQQVAAQQGGAPAGGAPADPSMGGAPMGPGGDPAAMGGMPPDAGMEAAPAGAVAPAQEGMDPSMPLPPDVAAGGMPAGDPSAMAAAPDGGAAMGDPADMGGADGGAEDPVMEIASAVMSGVEATLEEFTASLEKKISEMLDKIDALDKTVNALQSITDRRKDEDKDKEAALAADLDAELMPTLDAGIPAPAAIDLPKTASKKPANLYSFICKKG